MLNIYYKSLTLLWVLSGLWTALFLTWLALTPLDFGYKFWYQVLGTDQVINKYAPRNHHNKQNFIQTNKIEHERLFSEIIVKIHHGGNGLAGITYYDPNGKRLDLLFTKPEVQHLQDIADIINIMFKFSLASLILFILLCGWLIRRKKVPKLRKIALYLGCVILIATIAVFIIGPEKVFYQLHTWIFPVGHQWFFFFEDSLMVTLMHGTLLFGMISILWFLFSLLVYLVFVIGMYKLQRISSIPNDKCQI
ncbi:MAG: putative membrane protein [Francisellaceae bacterium]